MTDTRWKVVEVSAESDKKQRYKCRQLISNDAGWFMEVSNWPQDVYAMTTFTDVDGQLNSQVYIRYEDNEHVNTHYFRSDGYDTNHAKKPIPMEWPTHPDANERHNDVSQNRVFLFVAALLVILFISVAHSLGEHPWLV